MKIDVSKLSRSECQSLYAELIARMRELKKADADLKKIDKTAARAAKLEMIAKIISLIDAGATYADAATQTGVTKWYASHEYKRERWRRKSAAAKAAREIERQAEEAKAKARSAQLIAEGLLEGREVEMCETITVGEHVFEKGLRGRVTSVFEGDEIIFVHFDWHPPISLTVYRHMIRAVPDG